MSDLLPPVPPENPPTAIPAGWYTDPAGQFHYRWWESTGWTTWVAHDDDTFVRPLPDHRSASAKTTASFPPAGVLWAIGGWFLAIVASGLLLVGGDLIDDSLTTQLLTSTIGLYGGTTLIVWFLSRRYGTGRIFSDLGVSIRWIDLALGLATGVAARALSVTMSILVIYVTGDTDADPGQLDSLKESDTAVVVALIFAVFAAPFFEELFFRGAIQRSFAGRWRPAMAIAAASLLFGAVHLSPDGTTTTNLVLFSSTAVAGACFGFSYWATKRLGAAMIGHFFFNLVAAVALAWDQFG